MGKYTRLAVERHVRDTKRDDIYFDMKAAQLVIDFFGILPHVKGRWARENKMIELEGWQQFLLAMKWGWKRENGLRRFTTCYTEVARKNTKSTMGAGECLFALTLDREAGAEIYTAATKKEQAKVVFEIADMMVRRSPSLHSMIGSRVNNLHYNEAGSRMEPLSSVSEKLDGLNTHFAEIDEYHAWKSDDLYNVIESSMGSRDQPMMNIITTAGFNQAGPCYQLRKMIVQILEGKKTDDSTFGIIYTLDEDDNWEDPSTWAKANPNLGVSVSLDYLEDQLIKAKNEGETKVINFKTKFLNIWTTTSTGFITDEKWMKCDKGKVTPESLAGRTCYAGLDLASKIDITAFVLLFPPDEHDGVFQMLRWFWVPEDSARQRSKEDGVMYVDWIAEGLIMSTPGNSTDYDYIRKKIYEIATKFDIRVIGYDPWNATYLAQQLQKDGAPVQPFNQGIRYMSEPTKELEKMIISEKINHQGDPILRWMNGNVELVRDPNANYKPDKGKSAEKIDGIVALIIALGEFITDQGDDVINIPEDGLDFIEL